MRYFGGKYRIAKDIVACINQYRPDENVIYFEPFLGGANILPRIRGKRCGADANPWLIALYKSLQTGWVPPDSISTEEYKQAQHSDATPAHLKAFVGFGCSFAGKWFGGHANSATRNYAMNAKNSLVKKTPGLVGVPLYARGYDEFSPKGCVIYCDPPYEGTTQYTATGKFDSTDFWTRMSQWARNNIVLVSEYAAPAQHTVVWEKQVTTDIRGGEGKIQRVEKVFLVSPD